MIDLRKHLLSTTMVVGLAALVPAALPAVALAQSTTTSQDDQDKDKDKAADQVEEVVVVGSRLRTDNYNAPSPVQVITRDEATLAGFTSTTSLLQGTAVTGGTSQINNAYGGYVTNGGPGANTLSLRGLGATRTLVLLNGRRVAPAGSRGSVGSADLNVLPTAMIERIEVLKDGASSIYGSDAIAGVVNIVTDKGVDGVTVSGQYNFTNDANGGGDENRFSIVAGTHGDRWHIAGSAERYVREELTLGDRAFTSCPRDLRTNGSDYIDPLTGLSKCFSLNSGGVTINTIGTSTIAGVGATNAVGTSFNRWRPNAAVTTGLVGFEGVGNTATNTSVRDTYDPDMLNTSLITPVDITTGYAEGSYDLHALGNAQVYGEVLVNQRQSSSTDYRQLVLDYAKGSPLIPANLAGSTISATDLGLNPGSAVGVRAFIGYGNTESQQRVDFAKELAGIRGDLFLPDWHYDAYVSYTRSKSVYTSEQFLTDRLQKSLNVVKNADGSFSCVSTDANCVAAPYLNSATISGVLPQAWVNYVKQDVTGTTIYDETVASVGFDGPLFTLPAGQVMAYVGAEYRKSSIDDTPGIDSQTGNTYNYSSSAITRGSDSVTELFGEVEVPILADLPFAKTLTFTGSARWTDYESYGDDSTYKVGLVYQPFDFLTFRGAYGTSYRAPALFEQFVGATSGFVSSTADPCNSYGSTGTDPIVAANCASEGLAGSFNQTSSVAVITSGGADNNLSAETSDNLTVGLILQPKLPDGWGKLSFAADYYEIKIDNGVSRIGYSSIIGLCYSSAAAEFQADNGYCGLIDRNASTGALTVHDSYVNVATDVVHGIDYTLRYANDFGPGHAIFNLGVTQTTERYSTLFADDPILDEVGTIGTPEFSANFDAAYAFDKWTVHYGIEWIDSMGYDQYYLKNYGYTLASLGYDSEVSDYYLHNASVQYASDGWTATAGMRNLFNEEPPTLSAGVVSRVGNAPLYSGYDYVGRTFFINLSKSF